MTQRSAPVHEIRVGSIRASIWANVSRDQRTFYNVSVCRMYRDADQFRDSQSFGRDDLPVLIKAVELAWTWIWNQSGRAGEAPVAQATYGLPVRTENNLCG